MQYNMIGYNTIELPVPKELDPTKEKDKRKLEVFEIEPEPAAEDVFSSAAGAMSYNYDLVSIPTSVAEQIKTYRRISISAEIDLALKEIENEIFIFDIQDQKAIDIDFHPNSKLSKTVQKKIQQEFDSVYYKLLRFHKRGARLFTDWYVDGRLYMYKVVDSKKPKDGIQKLIAIDPLNIKKIREIPDIDTTTGTFDLSEVKEYYVWTQKEEYTRRGMPQFQTHALTIQPEAISYIDSGIEDRTTNQPISFLHKAIMPFNNLRLLEDSMIIYRVTRSPERRVIYVDVGNLPKAKAEQYMKSLMAKFKNKLVFDSQSGGLVDKKSIMSMVEDYYLPRRDNKATEITTLPGSQNDGIVEDVNYMKNKLYQALNVPINRFSENAPSFMFGNATEVYRDEYRFKKFIDRLRQKFIEIPADVLKTQLVLKKIISPEEWDDIESEIQWKFAEDNYMVEYKESSVLQNRLQLLQMLENYVGNYFTREHVLTKVLKYTQEEIDELNKEKEKNDANSDDNDDGDGEGNFAGGVVGGGKNGNEKNDKYNDKDNNDIEQNQENTTVL